MPKSKRDKEVSLTKVKKRNNRERKTTLVEEIRQSTDNYQRLFIFSIENSRNYKLKDLRNEFRDDSRFFFGRNRVMGLALGRIAEEEYREGLHKVSRHLSGQCGLLFTNRSVEDVKNYFADFRASDFARSGTVASCTVKLDEGPLNQFQFSMEPQLRKLGLPTTLKKGVITLLENFTVCSEGDKLTPEQAKILKLLNMQLAEFRINLLCEWNKKESKCHSFKAKRKKKNIEEKMIVDA